MASIDHLARGRTDSEFVMQPNAEPTLRGAAAGQRVFGRYVLVRILGRGGMGVVWAAHDATLGEDVALKFLPDAVRWDPAAFEDLKAETRRARQLTHPNIVRIHDFVEDGGAAAISMELVSGKTLSELRLEKANKVLEPADIAPWLPQLCAALDYAHLQAHVVHRDLKPSNLMLTDSGVLKLADFGVARSLADSLTRASMMSAGTLVFMSPQQAMGEEPTPADDIYALGATLYELLAGKPPFHTGDVRLQLFQRKPDSLAMRRRAAGAGRIPASWEKTVAACLAKRPEERPLGAGDVAVRVAAVKPRAGNIFGSLGFRFASASARKLSVRLRLLLGLLAFVSAGFAIWQRWKNGAAEVAVPGRVFPSDATRALGAWNFDGDARDGSGHGLDGDANGTIPTADRFGRIDRALHFNGNAAVVVADVPLLRWSGAQPFTAALWVRNMESGPVNGEVWAGTPDTVGAIIWSVGFHNGHPNGCLGRLHDGEYADQIQLIGSRALPIDEWHHLAVMSDGVAFSLWVDGVKVAAQALGPNRTSLQPRHIELRFGRTARLNPWALTGDLDDARLWRRALGGNEIASLAERSPPKRFVISRGTYAENDDLAMALQAEFGGAGTLADWDEIKRLHSDDPRAWGDEMGFKSGDVAGWLQRGNERRFDGKRHYFLTRFDGIKPEYFLAHDEIGGATFVLGSWYGIQNRLLVALPAAAPKVESLRPDADGAIRGRPAGPIADGLALTWRLALVPDRVQAIVASLRMRDGHELRAVCLPDRNGALAVALGEHSRQVAANFGECEFTLVAREGMLRFRATSVVGGSPVFSEEITAPGFRPGDVVAMELNAGAQSALASAQLIIE